MQINKIFYKNNAFNLFMDDTSIKKPGDNLLGMIGFYLKEKNILLKENYEIEYKIFLQEYHNLIFEKFQKGEVWQVVIKVPSGNPEIPFLSKPVSEMLFDNELAHNILHDFQKNNEILGAIYEIKQIKV